MKNECVKVLDEEQGLSVNTAHENNVRDTHKRRYMFGND
jgi:hypothetical protein